MDFITPLTVCVTLSVAVIVVIVWFFNRLVRQRNRLREAWSGIEVQLKRRHDLVPGLVEIVKGYSQHEHEVLKNVTQARSEARDADHSQVGKTGKAEDHLSIDITRLMILSENYPKLRADAQFAKLAHQLVHTEDQLQYARRYYNGCARDMNNLVETFPSSLIAAAFQFGLVDFFEVSSVSERLPPNLKKEFS